MQGLTITVDLFDIESKGRVIIPSIPSVIDRSVAGQSLPLESVNRDANGEIVSIELAYQNAGSQKARGVDFGIQYQIQTQFGIFTSLTQATYLDSFQFAEVPGDTEVELRSGVTPGVSLRRGVFEVESQFPPRLGLARVRSGNNGPLSRWLS